MRFKTGLESIAQDCQRSGYAEEERSNYYAKIHNGIEWGCDFM